MSDKFAKIPVATTRRSTHDLSAPHITTTDFGRLDVVYHTQLVPGDTFRANLRSMLRAAPMPQPTMGKVTLNVRAFFVPNRILCNKNTFDWDLWRDGLQANSHPYITEQTLIGKYIGSGAVAATHKRDMRRLLGQLGFPARVINRTVAFDPSGEYNQKYNPFSCASYNRIWWDWYRDSNLIDDSQRPNYVNSLDAGNNLLSKFEPRYCCYPKDYFTTAKVNPQSSVEPAGSRSDVSSSPAFVQPGSNPNNVLLNGTPVSNVIGNSTHSVPINFLRTANSLQKYLERNNIAGGRVMARYYARFGKTPDSVRLDQSEYIGGFSTPLNISDVTSPANVGSLSVSPSQAFISGLDDSYAGQQAGKGYVNGGDSIFYHAQEDGTLMIISTLVPEVYYFEGIPSDLLRGVDNVKEDYFTPEFENIGYEPIRKKQLAANKADVDGTAIGNLTCRGDTLDVANQVVVTGCGGQAGFFCLIITPCRPGNACAAMLA